MLVDDETLARKGLQCTFPWEEYGFTLAGEASNGQKAVRWMEVHPIDILITDIKMPVMDGLQLTRWTREHLPWARVLLLSCYSDFEYVREGLRLGASDYLLKPTMETGQLKAALDKMKREVEKERETLRLRERFLREQRGPAGRHDSAAAGTAEENGFHRRIVQQAIEYIRCHYTGMISLQDAADHVGVSKNYFSELFKKVTGQNFIDYLIEIRLNRAKELLATTSLKVYEVAEHSGFNDVKHFSKLFKKQTRMSPAEFREAR
jgi:YesN/AraC family two-component response regulator